MLLLAQVLQVFWYLAASLPSPSLLLLAPLGERHVSKLRSENRGSSWLGGVTAPVPWLTVQEHVNVRVSWHTTPSMFPSYFV